MPLDLETSVDFPTDQIVTGQAKVGDTVVDYTVSVGGPEIMVLVPGLAGCKAFSKPLRDQHGLRGYAAVSYEAARSRRTIREAGGDIRETARDMSNPSSLHLDTLTAVIDDVAHNKAFRDTDFGSTLNLETVQLGPHSFGARAAIDYALRHPAEVSSTVMLAPHGLEKLLALHLLLRSRAVIMDEFIPFLNPSRWKQLAEMVPALAGHAAASPLRLACEGISCAVDASNLNRLALLGNTGKVAIMGFARDKIINSAALARAAELHGIPFELHPDKNAGHFALYTHAPTVAELAEEMHRQLKFPPPTLVTT